jgi:hypothetical protein
MSHIKRILHDAQELKISRLVPNPNLTEDQLKVIAGWHDNNAKKIDNLIQGKR